MYIVKLHAKSKGWLDLTVLGQQEVKELVDFALRHDLEIKIEKDVEPAEVTPDAEQSN